MKKSLIVLSMLGLICTGCAGQELYSETESVATTQHQVKTTKPVQEEAVPKKTGTQINKSLDASGLNPIFSE